VDAFFPWAPAVARAAGLDPMSLRDDVRLRAVGRFPAFAEARGLRGVLRVVGAGALFFAPGFAACRAAALALPRAAAGFFRAVWFVGDTCLALALDSGDGDSDASGTNSSPPGPV
jgi:hypothetical protein